MASNLQRLGGYIGGKISNAKDSLVAGAKASVYEANPAMFSGIESGISSLRKSFDKNNTDNEKRAREEQARNKRSRGVDENNAREQAYKDKLDSDRLVSMDNTLKKILKALTKSSTGDGENFEFSLAGLIPPFLAGTEDIIRASRQIAQTARAAARGVTQAARAIRPPRSGGPRPPRIGGTRPPRIGGTRPPRISGPRLQGFGRNFGGARIIEGEFKILQQTMNERFLSSLRTFTTSIKESLTVEKLLQPFVRAAASIKSLFVGPTGLITKIIAPFVAIGTTIKNLLSAIKSTEVVSRFLAFLKESQFLKNILNVGRQFLVFFGRILGPIFGAINAFFDDDYLAQQVDKDVKDLGFAERLAGFIGGWVGGLFDAIYFIAAKLTSWITGTDYDKIMGDNEGIFTEKITGFFDFLFDWIGTGIDAWTAWFNGDDNELNKKLKDLAWLEFQVAKPLMGIFNEIKWSFQETVALMVLKMGEIGDWFIEQGLQFEKWWVENIEFGTEDVASKLMNNIVSWYESVINGIIDGINGFIDDAFDAMPYWLADNLPESVSRENLKLGNKKFDRYVPATDNKGREERIGEIDAAIESIDAESKSKQNYDAKMADIENERTFFYNYIIEQENKLAEDSEIAKESYTPDSEPVNSEQNPDGPATLESQENLESSINDVSDGVDGNTAAINAASESAQTSVAITEDNADQRTAEQIRVQQELERAAIQNRNEGVDRLLQGQSQLVQALMGPLLKGEEGGGPLGTLFDNLGSIFGGGKKDGGMFSKIGDLFGGKDGKIGNFFKNLGGGEGGWFDKLTGTIGDFASVGEDIKNLFTLGGSGASSGTSLLNTPGFGGGTGNMDPLTALLGSTLSDKLGLSGVGANAAFDVAQSLLTPGSGMAGIKSAVAGPGGFAGVMGNYFTLKNADINTLGGAISGGLATYRALTGPTFGSMLGQAAIKMGGKLLANNANSWLGQKAVEFGAGALKGSTTSTIAGHLGKGVGAVGSAMMTHQIAEFISGGYTANKYLNKIAAAVSMIPGVGPIAGVIAGTINRLFGRKEKEYGETGLDLSIGSNSTGRSYAEWVKKGGVYRSDKRGTDYEDLDSDFLNSISDAAVDIQNSYGKIAGIMGLNAESIQGFTKQYKINLEGMNEKQQQEALAKAMVKYAEDAVRYSYGDVSKYSLEGEDTLTTFTRMASAVENVAYWFDALGSSAEQTAAMFDTFATSDYFLGTLNTGGYKATSAAAGRGGRVQIEGIDYQVDYESGRGSGWFTPEVQAAIAYYQTQQGTSSATQTEEEKLLARAAAQAEYIQMYGGEEEFAKVSGFYFENFYSAEEKAEFQSRQATKIAQEQMAALAENLALLEDELIAAGVDPTFVDNIGNFESREQFETAKSDYRKAIEAAAEAGDMELHSQLMMAAESFIAAGEMQLRAAEMAGELENKQTDLFEGLDLYQSTGVDISRVGQSPPEGYATWEDYDRAMAEAKALELEQAEEDKIDDSSNIETNPPADDSNNIETETGARDDAGNISGNADNNANNSGGARIQQGGTEGNISVSGGTDNSNHTQINNYLQQTQLRPYHPIINANIRLPGIKIGHIGL